ncbi:hypothetical protein K402DRAFT_380336 [Aulographum hederae CBS 113979]|uniref:C2H2-type domain-containing protein n=1 Tax=Aulographum hederae CBS 113979 TaxID=1176131 RepID=A0A6G1GVY7_9PEZI|nr:hypothetical protein K402DRAFT_380336 [Aulographum hederae CBS 113979]
MASAVSPAAGTPSSHPFTCNTCQVAFRASELQRGHMQSDWHRYNLKRRVASLPPLSSEIFTEKVLANKASQAATAARASFEKSCEFCTKTYYSENAFINHLSSHKHKMNVAKAEKAARTRTDDETISVMSSTFSLPSIDKPVTDDDQDISKIEEGVKNASMQDKNATPTLSRTTTMTNASTDPSDPSDPSKKLVENCLFCNFHSPTFPLNVEHMVRHHSLFIPERAYLADLEGLIRYLSLKVTEGHECLYCGKQKHTAEGVQTHMRDSGHCKIAYGTEEEMLEIGKFYDFRASYSDSDEDTDMDSDDDSEEPPQQKGGVKLGAARPTKIAVEGNGNDEDEEMPDGAEGEDWETDSSVCSENLTSVPIDDHSHQYAELKNHRHHSHNAGDRQHRHIDGFHSHAHDQRIPHAVYYDEFEMHLPSGRSIGHRNWNRYFKQNLRDHPSAAERAELHAQRMITDNENGGSSDDNSHGIRALQTTRPVRDRGRQLAGRANGAMSMAGVTEARKKEVKAMEKRERKAERRDRARVQWFSDTKGNSQKHFRDPLLQ